MSFPHDFGRLQVVELHGRPVAVRKIRETDAERTCPDCGSWAEWLIFELQKSNGPDEIWRWGWCGVCSIGG